MRVVPAHRIPLDIRLRRNTRRTPTCWIWTGTYRSSGYGQIKIDGRPETAHRIVWQHVYGPIPPGLCVLHRCDVRRCVRPSHLWLGTLRENSLDMQRKGRARTPRGSANGQSKLTERQVREIRRLYVVGNLNKYARVGPSQPELAARFGVSPRAIGKIVTDQDWRHL